MPEKEKASGCTRYSPNVLRLYSALSTFNANNIIMTLS